MMVWKALDTVSRIELITKVWKPDWPAARIAEEISKLVQGPEVSRAAILGLYKRNPKLGTDHPLGGQSIGELNKKRNAENRKTRTRKSKPKSADQPKPMKSVYRSFLTAEQIAYEASSQHIPFDQLDGSNCHWPINNPPPRGQFFFCGNPATDKSHYCHHHWKRSKPRVSDVPDA